MTTAIDMLAAKGDEILSVGKDSKVFDAIKIMNQNNIHHLPVIEDRKLVGIISMKDLIDYKLKDMEFKNKILVDYITKD